MINYTFAFDLDGTICDYGLSVRKDVANVLNALGTVYIVTGGSVENARRQTQLIKKKKLYGLRDKPYNFSIDLSEVLDIPKDQFISSLHFQEVRRNFVLELRRAFGDKIYVGGRSTVDIMLGSTKADIIKSLPGKVIYFYDCQWHINEDINNDMPAIGASWMAIKTDHERVIGDIQECQRKLSSLSQEALIP